MDVTTTVDSATAPDGAGARAEPLHELIQQLTAIARASALEEMASGIAHELNQPLGAIVTFAQTAERMLNRPTPMVNEATEVLRLISKEALGASEGIRRIRRLFNRDSLSKSICRMDEVVREMSPVLELLALRTGGHLTVGIDRTPQPVHIDRLRIQHVLFTLVQNAFDATDREARGGEVCIKVVADRYGVEVSVTDNGGGIAVDRQEQIFHPFYTTKPQGTGLGLASTRAIVEAHEGTIGFENVGDDEHSGARFWFRIPAYCEQASP